MVRTGRPKGLVREEGMMYLHYPFVGKGTYWPWTDPAKGVFAVMMPNTFLQTRKSCE